MWMKKKKTMRKTRKPNKNKTNININKYYILCDSQIQFDICSLPLIFTYAYYTWAWSVAPLFTPNSISPVVLVLLFEINTRRILFHSEINNPRSCVVNMHVYMFTIALYNSISRVQREQVIYWRDQVEWILETN
jgi:hypothetical protein